MDCKTKPELIAAIAVLGMDSWITELDTANQSIASRYLERIQKLGAASPHTIKAKRPEVATARYKLRDKLNTLRNKTEVLNPGPKR